MPKKVLVALSEKGFWVEELLKPLDRLKEAGIAYDFLVNTGKTTPFPDGASLEAAYVDPPLGRPVTTDEMAERGKSTNWDTFFTDTIVLKDLMPVRPYLSSERYLYALEDYYKARQDAWEKLNDYDALLMVGGGGAVVDMVNNNRLHDVILGFYYRDKPIAAECYTVTCLAFARELDSRKSILVGRHVTGHTMEYDYTANWAIFANGDYFNFDSPPFPLEYILRDTVGVHGRFHSNIGRATSVIVDYPFITSRSVESSDECGRLLVDVLEKGVRKYGW
ncbi:MULTISPECIES: type 1 glutamine amidotransferase domain-containing protein [unclassified Fusibacter]|uniref:type 1 glutamine amidotransferase domain-containing protein n=1 Tax=unclassified Fusibacter TaxID=2624464 RepID=UPI001010E8C8|nr:MULTISPECIES: type 1 glutamine amidotransferase domain-containing protein [unclassified Fusibacter]MCK8058463.1 DJ-1/PfpI family protein [Fusibacter sp. A2]NPE22769.1 type 1 glutamine amidotransferase domain-containing protein [Fusibacter sp. A1]RXV60327.1 type 1 glutamine amidotransferase domain-containing protein [Fusibacter sp. A1]